MVTYENGSEPADYLRCFESDTFGCYPCAPADVREAFMESIKVFENNLPDLWRKGFRIWIVPQSTKVTDMPGCSGAGSECNDDRYRGLYLWNRRENRKLALIKEKDLKQRRNALKHEIGHAIWHLLLTNSDRGYLKKVYKREKRENPDRNRDYRMSNPGEFFADSLAYYHTFHTEPKVIEVREYVVEPFIFGTNAVHIREVMKEGSLEPTKKTLESLNPEMLSYLEEKERKGWKWR